MKKVIIGIVLGAAVAGGIGNYATLQYEQQVQRQKKQINQMGNDIAQLKMANNQLMIENAQLHEQIK